MKKQRTPEACETWPLTKNTTHLQLPLLEDLPSPETQATQPTKAEENIFQLWIRPVEPPTAHFALRLALHELDRLVEKGLTESDFEETRAFLARNVNLLLKTKANEWFFVLKRYTEQKFSAFQNKFLDKY